MRKDHVFKYYLRTKLDDVLASAHFTELLDVLRYRGKMLLVSGDSGIIYGSQKQIVAGEAEHLRQGEAEHMCAGRTGSHQQELAILFAGAILLSLIYVLKPGRHLK